MTTEISSTLGILLMTYGSPATLEDVPSYLASVRRGQPVPGELIAEFQRRYSLIGGSPLLRNTLEQASALESLLNAQAKDGGRYSVRVGMLHAPPFVSDALAGFASEGVSRIIAIILSPQYSPIIMGRYQQAVMEATSCLGKGMEVRVAGAWHTLPTFLDALAQRVREALIRFPPQERGRVPVIFTAHSMPKNVVEREPDYTEQLRKTADTVAERLGLPSERCWFAYQSAGHTPEEWLKPDLKELFPALAKEGYKSVLVVPIQFVADHLELLYDIDIAARDEAEGAGLNMVRCEALNSMPQFIQGLADLVHLEATSWTEEMNSTTVTH